MATDAERSKPAPDIFAAALEAGATRLHGAAIGIGERLEVLKDYPTPPNCTSPFAPAWITEIVRRKEDAG